MIDRGKLPQGWEIKKLPEVLDFLPGKAHEPYVSENGEFTVANSKFVSTQGAVRKYATINVSPAEPGDILVVMSDLPNGRALGKAYLVGEGEKIAVNQRVCALRTKIGVPAFYHYQLDRSPYFLSFDDGINQTHLLNPIFENCPIVTAPLPEQRKIAEILSAWDEATRRLSSLLAAKRKRFSWLRTHVLSGRLRLPGFFGEWPILPLAVSLKENRLTSTGAEEVFSVSVHKGLINQVEHLGRSFAAQDTGRYNRVLPGDIVYTKSPTGNFPLGIIKQSKIDKEVIVSPLYGVFTPVTRELGVILDAYFASPITVRNYLHPLVQKGAKNTIAVTNKRFLEGKLSLPLDAREQRAIAELIETAQAGIASVETEIEILGRQRRGLIQKLLTGEWRVKVDEQTEAVA